MKTARYILTILCISVLFACNQKSKSVSDAIKNESRAHTDTNGTKDIAIAGDKLIIPGKSIGQTGLNEAANAVVNRLGKPDFGDAAMGKSVSAWYDGHNRKSYTVYIYCTTDMGNDDISRVKVIRVSSPSFKTQNRLYAGMLIADAQKHYKLEQLGAFKLNNSNRMLYDDTAVGIAFDADRSGNITGIAVHEPGKSVLNAYMAFFGEVKK